MPGEYEDKYEYDIQENLRELGKAFDGDEDFAARVLERIDTQTQYPGYENDKSKLLKRIIMSNKISTLATAALFLAGIAVCLHFFGGSLDGAKVAWAKVSEMVNSIDTFSYRATVRTSMFGENADKLKQKEVTIEVEAYVDRELGVRSENYLDGNLGQLSWIVVPDGVMYSMMPDEKKYLKMELTDSMMENMRKQSGDPRLMIDQVLKCEHISLGRAEMDGVDVEGVRSTDPKLAGGMFDNVVMDVWVDVQTQLPYLIEFEAVSDENGMQMEMVIDSFNWNIELDRQLFVPDIPEDYELMAQAKMPETTPEGVIECFEVFLEIFGDEKYPASLNQMAMTKKLAEGMKKVTPKGQEPSQEFMNRFMKVQSLSIIYAMLLQENRDPAYYGDIVRPGDSQLPLMRWLDKEGGDYVVIYGDLTYETVTAGELAKIEIPLDQGQ